MRNMLLTRDKLVSWGLQVLSNCLLCYDPQETISHLFFSCTYSLQIFRGLFCHYTFNPPADLMDTVNWVLRASSVRKVKTICSLVLQAIVYEVWKERNSRLHSTSSRPASVLIKEIQLIIRKKLFSMDRAERRGLVPSVEIFYLSHWFGLFQFTTHPSSSISPT